ncbi:MAG: Mov34/MPN/PAD-1 family protein [Bacteroidetes bacterium]|nr:Mov34/MPN/PAD-1 family protein [Bacteroidota bacterium]
MAYKHMREAGKHQLEGVALFSGKENENIFRIEKTIVPEQHAMSLEDGLLYSVSGDELHRINVWLYENKMSLIAQIHSHPTRAYHSATDDAYPIVATVGGVSIVVPDFAFGEADINCCAVYRLHPEKGWIELDKKIKNELIEVIK